MADTKLKYDIVPLFDQKSNPGIWKDFTRIEQKCDIVNYGYTGDRADIIRMHFDHVDVWKNEDYNFAFAAYSGVKMLGFIKGYKKENGNLYLRSLYVEPEFQCQGIGSALLQKAERAGSIVAPRIEIVSLTKSIGFYKNCGYSYKFGCEMTKRLPQFFADIVPVFQWRDKLRAELKVNVDTDLLKENKYQPIFANVTPMCEINGVGLRTKDQGNVLWIDESMDDESAILCRNNLIDNLNKYKTR